MSNLPQKLLVVGTALLLVAPVPVCLAQAAEPPLDAAADDRRHFQAAVLQAPALAAALARIDAARARTGAAGRLPDPELEAMGGRMDMPDENRTMWSLSLRQPLPKAGERGADRARAQAVVAMSEADFAVMAGEMAMNVAMNAAELEGAEQRIALLEAQIARLEAVLRSIDTRLAAGGGSLADRLGTQTRIASMALMLDDERRMAADARDAMRALLGTPDGAAALPAFAAPEAVQLEADATPAVQLARAREAEAIAMQSMARSSARPMTAVGVRLEREKTRMGNEDTVGLAFMTEIPWRSRRYARAERRAAEADAAAARADAVSARLQVESAVARAARAGRLASTARTLSAETQARLDAEFEALVRAAAAGNGMGTDATVLMTVEILEKATDTQLQAIDAETQARIARAALWPHAPAAAWSQFMQENTNP